MDYEQAITMFTIYEGKKIWGYFEERQADGEGKNLHVRIHAKKMFIQKWQVVSWHPYGAGLEGLKEISYKKSGNVGHHNKDFVLQKPGVICHSLLNNLTQLNN